MTQEQLDQALAELRENGERIYKETGIRTADPTVWVERTAEQEKAERLIAEVMSGKRSLAGANAELGLGGGKKKYSNVWPRTGLPNRRADGPLGDRQEIVRLADDILSRYWDDGHGYALTLRQLFYKFVATGRIPNTPKAYENLGKLIRDARYAGLISWKMVIDRGRTVMEFETYDDEVEAIGNLSDEFLLDKWADQPARVEIWIEKDAAIGTIERVCRELQVPWVSTRGFHSASGAWKAAQRFLPWLDTQDVLVLHIADLDPSGWAMTADVQRRLDRMLLVDACGADPDELDAFDEDVPVTWRNPEPHLTPSAHEWTVDRIALNMGQVHTMIPRGPDGKVPSQPVKRDTVGEDGKVKRGDPNAKAFYAEFNSWRCWELDALEPEDLAQIIRERVLTVRDPVAWKAATAAQADYRESLRWRAKLDRELVEVTVRGRAAGYLRHRAVTEGAGL